MQPTIMFTEELKAGTQAHHQQTEKQLILRLKTMRSTADYVALLQMFYSFFGALEQQIELFVNQQHLPDYGQRRKTAAIGKDIQVLAGAVPPFADPGDLPKIDSAATALGALYVMEGSTLGGKIIVQMMRQHFTFNGDEGLGFFSGYGVNTDLMWSVFKNNLNKAAGSPADQSAILEAANQTFAKFSDWIAKSA